MIAAPRSATVPLHGAYAAYLRGMGGLLLERVDGPDAADPTDAADPPDANRGRILPMISGILQGRQALRDRDPDRALRELARGLLHLALIAFDSGDPHLRVLDFVRAQRARYDEYRGCHPVPWWEHEPKHHFDRVIANALALTHEIDAACPDRNRLRAQAADAANYLLFFLQTSRVPLPPRPGLPVTALEESHAP